MIYSLFLFFFNYKTQILKIILATKVRKIFQKYDLNINKQSRGNKKILFNCYFFSFLIFLY